MRIWADEDPSIHWPNDCINVKNRVVLDLGCGTFGDTWHRNHWMNTPIYWIAKGASKVVGLDVSEVDINILKNQYPNTDKFVFLAEGVSSTKQIKNLIVEHKIDVIKSDIEGFESILFDMSDEDFSLVKEYYIETHSIPLFYSALKKFKKCGYKIRELMKFAYTPEGQIIKLIFAVKK